MKNGLSRSEQRTVSKTQKQPLDTKNPIQVSCEPDFLDQRQSRSVVSLAGDRGFESISLQGGVCCEPARSDARLELGRTKTTSSSRETVPRSGASSRAGSAGKRLRGSDAIPRGGLSVRAARRAHARARHSV